MTYQIKEKPQECRPCGKTFTEMPDSPYPLSDAGVCCRACNQSKVVPERLRIEAERKKSRAMGGGKEARP